MDTKSSGILGACLIVAALIITLVPRPQPAQPAASAPPAPQVGRYQMGGVPGHAYVLDTATGQVWEDFASSGSGSSDDGFKKPKVK